ncbi:hypothetical protein AADX40_15530 [Aeromonas veronii]|uniref:hypothetical protein n=1 Tax=Aeromonas TaxID=642 RepID=UPI003158B605
MFEFIENLVAVGSRFFGSSLEDMIEVESKDSKYVLNCKDGSLLSVVEISGSLRMSGTREFDEVSTQVFNALRAHFNSGEHFIQIVFSSDPTMLADHLRDMTQPSVVAAKRIGIDAVDLFEDDINALSRFCTYEKVYLVLYTTPKKLTKKEVSINAEEKKKLFEEAPLPPMENAPALYTVIHSVRIRHDGFVQTFINELTNAEVLCDLLDAHKAVYVMKDSLCREFASKDWKPVLAGDKIPFRDISPEDGDLSGYIWPSIGEQLLVSDTEEVTKDIIKVGNQFYWPMYIHLHQEDILPFKTLLDRVGNNYPWRISFLMEPHGLTSLTAKNFVALLFSFMSPTHNGRYNASRDAVQHAKEKLNDHDVRYRVDFCTWGREIREVERNAEMLSRAVQGWGVAEVKSFSGDLLQSYLGVCVGLTRNSAATPSVATLSDVVTHLPIHRPASPWKTGNVLYRSRDGKPFPHQPMSTLVTSSITCMLAEPRYGKSLLANLINWAMAIAPGNTYLPLISVIDVGKASSGLISLLKHKLPAEQRHLAANIQLYNDEKHRINPCDTQLRCRYPIGTERDYISNVMLLLLTPEGAHAPAEGMQGVVNMAIDIGFRQASPEKSPKQYVPGMSEEVDQALDEMAWIAQWRSEQEKLYGSDDGIERLPTWWEVVDALFDDERYHEASLAQRYAVPTLLDFIPLVNSQPQFSDMFGNTSVGSEPILHVYTRMLSEAVRKYPLICGSTTWDIGTARVISINVENVIDKTNNGCQKNALMFMMAMYVATRNYSLHEDLLKSGVYPAECREYHRKRIMEFRQCAKHIQIDEYHRAKGIQSFENFINVFLREGGKWSVATTLISHRLDDFPKGFLEWVTSLYVLSPQTEESAEIISRELKLGATAKYAMMNEIKRPDHRGATFVGVFRTSRGTAIHLLNNTVGPKKLWAFSTSNEDSFIRDRLYERIGDSATRLVLSRIYPKGSLQSEYEERKSRLVNSGLEVDEKQGEGILNGMINELVSIYQEMKINGEQ